MQLSCLYNLPDIFTIENISSTTVINKEFFAQTVRDNTNIIDRDDNWNLLLYKEAYHIKRLTPFLNNGLKASRELRLFDLLTVSFLCFSLSRDYTVAQSRSI